MVLKKAEELSHNERIASKAEMHISASNIFSRTDVLLYELSEIINKKAKSMQKKNQNFIKILEKQKKILKEKGNSEAELIMITELYCLYKDQERFLYEFSNSLRSKDFLSNAIDHDLLASNLIKNITDLTNYKDVKLKSQNNKAYNIYLKQDRQNKWLELNKDKGLVAPIKLKVDEVEIHNAIEAREELFNFIKSGNICLCEDINDYHLVAWENTCRDIKLLIENLDEWKEIYNKKFSS